MSEDVSLDAIKAKVEKLRSELEGVEGEIESTRISLQGLLGREHEIREAITTAQLEVVDLLGADPYRLREAHHDRECKRAAEERKRAAEERASKS